MTTEYDKECAWCGGLVINSDSRLNKHPICDDCAELGEDVNELLTLQEEENKDMLHPVEPISEEEYYGIIERIDSFYGEDSDLGSGYEGWDKPENDLPILQ